MAASVTNWAENITFDARRLHHPTSLAQLRRVVAQAERIHPLGTGHSFNRVADSPGELVSVAGLPPTIELDTRRGTVTVAGGVRYGELAVRLHKAGYALHSLGSLPHISVAGACATGTHGSGNSNGNLASAVSAVQLVTADGELVQVSRRSDPDRFPGMVVALGALGVVTSLTMELVPDFEIRQYVYENLPGAGLAEHFDEVFASGYSVSMFTDWRSDRINHVWLKRRVEPGGAKPAPANWLGAELADGPRNPVPGMPAENCTEQLGVPGPWHERLPHFRLEFTPSSGEELQSEYFVPRAEAVPAFEALDEIRDRIAPVLQVSELRTIAADDLWLSPCYQQDSVAFHFTWIKDTAAVAPVLTAIEERLAPFRVRPHWGKLFNVGPEAIDERYPRIADFRRLLRDHDPAGKFRNDMIDRYFPAER